MGLNAILGTALSALNTSQRAVSISANNIANANTAGYARQVHNQSAQVLDGRTAGVQADDPTRMVDQFLEQQVRLQRGASARTEVLDSYLERAQDQVLGGPDAGAASLAGRLSALSESAETLSGTPESAPLAAAFLGDATSFANEVNRAAAAAQTLRGEVDQTIAGLVDTINGQIGQLHDLNREIARSGPTVELANRRDSLLGALSENLDVTVYRQDNGQVSIYARGGQALLEGAPRTLVYRPASNVGQQTVFGAIEIYDRRDIDPATGEPKAGADGAVLVSGGLRQAPTPEEIAAAADPAGLVITSPLASGRLQGLLETRDKILPALADQLGELADLAAFALNAAHNDAVAQPPPSSLSGSTADTGAFDAAVRAGTAYLALVDRSTGATTATIAIDVTQDRATLVAGLNAALGGQGTASIDAAGRLTLATTDANIGFALSAGDSSITVTDAAGRAREYGLAHYFGLNDLISRSAGGIALRQDIATDASLLGTARLDVAAGPPLTATLGGRGDGRGIAAVADAFQEVQSSVRRGDLPGGRTTLNRYAADLIGLVANQSAQAASRADGEDALLAELSGRAAAVSGVNVDEELSKLVLYQQSYSVAARLFSVTNQMFDDLFGIVS